MFCDLIGLILNNVTDLIGAKGERCVTILKTAARETTVYESRQTSKLKTTVL